MWQAIASVGKYFWTKLLGALVGLGLFEFFISSDELNRAITGLVFIIILDSFLGVYVALQMKRLASWRMGQPMARKVALYSVAIFSTIVLASSNQFFDWSPVYLTIFFLLSEMLSLFEKLALLGVPVPVGIVSRVNDLFKRYADGNTNALNDILKKK